MRRAARRDALAVALVSSCAWLLSASVVLIEGGIDHHARGHQSCPESFSLVVSGAKFAFPMNFSNAHISERAGLLRFEAEVGEPILASNAGRVSYSGLLGGRTVVIVSHPDSIETGYSFTGDAVVRAKDSVTRQEKIGRSTSRGLYFGMWRNGVSIALPVAPKQLSCTPISVN